ncbi:MAG: SDR family oxidoreductase, partial [Dehalococcoidia bacterium]|nr:SDR family oxidoreductase [Dehalococcoidia bacterium]
PDEILAATARQFGRLDILVNNAGFPADAVIHRMTDAQFQMMLDIHLVAPFRLIRVSSPLMRDQAKKELEDGVIVHRKIVNCTSTSAFGSAGQVNYAAAKSGLIGLTKAVAKEWGPFNIHCNAVAFGPIATRISGPKEDGVTVLGHPIGVPRAFGEQTVKDLPFRRLGTPREAASGIFYLASPLSDYVNGDLIKVDAGLRM